MPVVLEAAFVIEHGTVVEIPLLDWKIKFFEHPIGNENPADIRGDDFKYAGLENDFRIGLVDFISRSLYLLEVLFIILGKMPGEGCTTNKPGSYFGQHPYGVV